MHKNSKFALTRRHFLAAGAAATSLGIAGVGPARADANWRKSPVRPSK